MAKTGSSRRSRSDGGRRAAGVSGQAPGGSRGDALERTRDPAPATAPRSPATELGAQKPGAVRIVSCHGGEVDRIDRPRRPAEAHRRPGSPGLGRPREPDEAQVKAAADALGLHPLIAEDIRERNQRSKIESFDEDVVHIVLFALHYAGEAAAAEIDFVLGNGYLLTVHDGVARRVDGGAAPVRRRARPREGPGLPASTRSPTRSSTATSRSSTSSATTSTSSRTG